jgi:RNase P subunit RPR2
VEKKLNIPIKKWKSNFCYECEKDMTGIKSFWCKFAEIGGIVYQVKICDECESKDGVCTNQYPVNK